MNRDDMRREYKKYVERHRRRHGWRPAEDRAVWNAQRFLRRTFNIREGRAPYHVIRKRFVNGARLTGTHLCILIVAMVIACIGLDTDSDIAIVGAMLICPIMGSVLAIAYGIATLDRAVARDAVGGLAIQMVICLATSTLYFHLSPVASLTPALIDNSSPTVWDLLLALVGGFAGGLGNSRDQEPATLISGVAVATALMPPLCAAGYGIAAGEVALLLSALYEFGINVVFISLSAEIVLLLLRVPLERDLNDDGIVTEAEDEEAHALSRAIRRRVVIATAIFAIPCFILTGQGLQEPAGAGPESIDSSSTARELAAILPEFEELTISRHAALDATGAELRDELVATVRTDGALSADERKDAEALIRLDVPELDRVEFDAS
ncbi:MAG: DUF389 domain-containing protein [Collinsella sp.]|nr:DUF389 domain-containing protein [Collinsella sp.]